MYVVHDRRLDNLNNLMTKYGNNYADISPRAVRKEVFDFDDFSNIRPQRPKRGFSWDNAFCET